MLQSNMNKPNDFLRSADISLAPKLVPSTSGAPFDMQCLSFGIWGKSVGPDTGYGLASSPEVLNLESVKR